jgi:acetyltransferase-like isoleucine patch superfamily enzyme
MKDSFYSDEELKSLGLKKYGKNVLISKKASFYYFENISIGDNVRIDDFCILSGNIHIGSHVHISANSSLYGHFGIFINDYAGLSPHCIVFSATDDFSGDHLIGPMVDQNYRKLVGGPVVLKRFAQIGAGCVILPDVTIGEGCAVGSMSLITKSLEDWSICAGIPAKFVKSRSRKMLDLL